MNIKITNQMKKFIFLVVFCIISFVNAQAQYDNYLRISGDMGSIVNSQRDKKFGMGGNISWMITDNLLSLNSNNFVTLGLKAHNNPYGEGKFLSSINNNKDDAFNYLLPFVGYRITQKGVENGFFIEPRIGVAIGPNYTAFAIAPLAGYAYNAVDFSLYCDMGFGNEESPIGKKQFYNIGLSVAYNIKL